MTRAGVFERGRTSVSHRGLISLVVLLILAAMFLRPRKDSIKVDAIPSEVAAPTITALKAATFWKDVQSGPSANASPSVLDGRADLIGVDPDIIDGNLRAVRVRRYDGRAGKARWETALDPSKPPKGWDAAAWRGFLGVGVLWNHGLDLRPSAVGHPAPDLDGDGMQDVLLAGRASLPPRSLRAFPDLLSLSGKDGSILASYRQRLDPADAGAEVRRIGLPAFEDVDGDGAPELIVALERSPRSFQIEAISGREARPLWSRGIDGDWLIENKVGEPRFLAPELIRVRDQLTAVIVAGTRVMFLDARTGKPSWIKELPGTHDTSAKRGDGVALNSGSIAIQAPRFADLDGDGEFDVLLLCKGPILSNALDDCFLEAISLAKRQTLWTKPVAARFGPLHGEGDPEWPLVADFDGDGRAEILVPDAVERPPAPGVNENSGTTYGIAVRDGTDGNIKWRRDIHESRDIFPALTLERTIHHLNIGPVGDEAGTRGVFAASLREAPRPEPPSLRLDGFSANDGRPLWSRTESLPNPSEGSVFGPLRTWSTGPSGAPLLIVSVRSDRIASLDHGPPDTLRLFSTRTGEAALLVSGARNPIAADFDGDSIPDLAFQLGRGAFAGLADKPAAHGDWRAIPGRNR